MSEPTIEQMNEAIGMFDGWELISGDPNAICLSCDTGAQPSGWCTCDQKTDRFRKNGKTVASTYFQYDSSWDWLVPVVEKIHKLKEWREDKKELRLFSTITVDIEFDGHYKECRCSIIGTITHCHNESIPHTYTNIPVPHIWVNKKKTAIEATHQAIYQFIQWYQKQQSNEQ